MTTPMTPSTNPARDEAVPAVTDEMLQAARDTLPGGFTDICDADLEDIWEAMHRTMLSSAPAPASGVDAVRERAAQICEEARSVRGHIIEYDGMSFVKIDDVNAELNRRAAEIRALSPAATPVSEAGGEATDKPSLQVGSIPRSENTGRYLAETNDGRLLYLNHANEWQEMPNILAKPASSPVGGDVREAFEACARIAGGRESDGTVSWPDGHEIAEAIRDHADTWIKARFAAPSTSAAEPVAYASPEQIADLQDRPGDDLGGVYIPLRKVPAGLFQMPLYAHPAPAAVESTQGVRDGLLQAALDYLAENKSRSLTFDGKTFCEDDNSDLWIVTEVQGGLNDREWVLLGSGDTPAKALIDALPSSGIRASLATEKEG